MIYNLPEAGLMFIIIYLVSLLFAIFSPFNGMFIIFGILRRNSKSKSTKKISFVFQLIFIILLFMVSLGIALLVYDIGITFSLAEITGVLTLCIVQIIFIFVQSKKLNN